MVEETRGKTVVLSVCPSPLGVDVHFSCWSPLLSVLVSACHTLALPGAKRNLIWFSPVVQIHHCWPFGRVAFCMFPSHSAKRYDRSRFWHSCFGLIHAFIPRVHFERT